jgi:oxygen-independent coproporphyrinogen-3 oxidase
VGPSSTRADLGVYLHVPFCERVCPYCDFAVERVGVLSGETERAYLDLVVRELDLVLRERPELVGRPLATVYLGGGTPSLLSPGGVERLMDALARALTGSPSEVTLELNPEDADPDRLRGLERAGVTRLSVGVQSFDDLTLKRLGRAHKGRVALAGLESVLAAGFRSVSVDLIHGAPGQTEASVLADVRRVVALRVPHVSAYSLTVEPGTPFERARARGLLALPEEESAALMASRLQAELCAARYRRYEVSSWARAGQRSLHNLRYWRREDVLGLGVSAASLLGELRTRSYRERKRWAEEVRAGRLPWEETERLRGMDARREALFLGFRMVEGISRAAYRRRYGRRPEDDFGAELEELRALGLLEDAAGRLRPTARGILFSNEVLLRFVSVDPPGGCG